MSECVVRMEMPKNCYECEMRGAWVFCPIGKWPIVGYKKQRHEDCPIICELPEKHGDLVDFNEVRAEIDRAFSCVVKDEETGLQYREYPEALTRNPIKVKTIVPAERSEE